MQYIPFTLKNIPRYGNTTFCLSIHLPAGIEQVIPLSVVLKNAAMNVHVVFVWTYIFMDLWFTQERNCWAVRNSVFTIRQMVADDVASFFVGLLAIRISSLEKSLLIPFAYF